jgi:hypothetical protein
LSLLVATETRPTVQGIVGDFWAKLKAADPNFAIPVPIGAEAAEYCIGLLMDWVLNSEARWFHYGHLHREACSVLVELEEAARYEPVAPCTCATDPTRVTRQISLECPVHGLEAGADV